MIHRTPVVPYQTESTEQQQNVYFSLEKYAKDSKLTNYVESCNFTT